VKAKRVVTALLAMLAAAVIGYASGVALAAVL
jgi:hypothetical protein